MNKFYVKAVTLFELIVCILIISICATIALPHFQDMLARQESQKIRQTLMQSFQYAKTQANLFRSRMVICASSSGSTCNNNQWSDGFIIFNDQNENNQVDSDEQIHTYQNLGLKYGTLAWRGALSRSNVFFNAQQGLPNGSNGSFYYCSIRSQPHQRVILSNMGQARVETVSEC